MPWVPLPHTLTLETTSHCNLRCPMCPKTNHFVNTPENEVMSREVFDRVKPILSAVSAVDLTGLWGEAFLHREWYLEMLAELKQHSIRVSTTSNGTLIGDAFARQLVELGLDRLAISVDAATPETFAVVRPPGRMETVIEGLAAVKRWKKELGKTQPAVQLSFVGLARNIDEFPDFVRMAGDLGADGVVLQAAGEYKGIEGESVAFHFKDLGRRRFEEGAAVAHEQGLDIRLFPPDQFEEQREDRNVPADTSALFKDCSDPWIQAVITTRGDVLPCCACEVPLGNIVEKTFREIWYGPGYRELRRQLRTSQPPLMCRFCTGRPWARKSLRNSARLQALLLGIHTNRVLGDSRLFRAVKPALKRLRDRVL
ncbi:MAG: radical SAM protein [Lentisphaerae bacterium]|nr:radical SAM protein [Lentisphaerota bacterium]